MKNLTKFQRASILLIAALLNAIVLITVAKAVQGDTDSVVRPTITKEQF